MSDEEGAMTTDIAERTEEALATEGATFSRTGVDLDPHLHYTEWQHVGEVIGMVYRASPWFIGDWIIFGEGKYGERYSHAVNDLGLDYKTTVNTAYVCRKVPRQRRREDLSFSHHAEVAALDPADQEKYLALAAEEKWTRSDLRAAIKDRGALPPKPKQPEWSKESGIHPGGDSLPLPDGPTSTETPIERQPEVAEAVASAQPENEKPHLEVLPPPTDSEAYIPDAAFDAVHDFRVWLEEKRERGVKQVRVSSVLEKVEALEATLQ